MLKNLIIGLSVINLISSCATTNMSSDYCDIYKPILYNKGDISHEGVLYLIRLNNSSYLDICLKEDLTQVSLPPSP